MAAEYQQMIEALNTLIDLNKKAAKKTEQHRIEQEKAELGLVAYKDSMRGLSAEIQNVNNFSKEMGRTMAQAAQESKVWTAASRLLSGTGLWSIQNGIRGIIDVFAIYDTSQQKALNRQNQAAKVMENYSDVLEKYKEEQTRLNTAIEEGADATYWETNAAYQLMRQKKISHDVSVKLLKEEMEVMDDMIKQQKRLIEGSWFSKKTADLRARIGLKFRKRLKKDFRNREEYVNKVNKGRIKVDMGSVNTGENIKQFTGLDAKAIHHFTEMVKPLEMGVSAIGKTAEMLGKGATKGISQAFGVGKAIWDMGPDSSKQRREKRKMSKFKEEQGIGFSGQQFDAVLEGGLNLKERKKKPGGWDSWANFKKRVAFERGQFNRSKFGKKMLQFQDFLTKKVIPNVMFVFSKLKMAMFYFIAALLVIMALMPLIKSLWEGIKEASGILSEIGIGLWDQVKGIWKDAVKLLEITWGMVYAAFTGDAEALIDYSLEFLWVGAKLLFKLAALTFTVAIGAAVALGLGIWNYIVTNGPGKLLKLLLYAGLILIVYHIAAQAIALVTSIIAGIIGAIPVGIALLAIAIGVVLHQFGRWVGENLFGFSEGGVVNHTGMSLVGEKGPELVNLPRGSRVFSNKDSRQMIGGSTTNNISVNVQGRVGASDSEIRDIARKVGVQINREINRTTSSATRS
jgi:hypothetical protein